MQLPIMMRSPPYSNFCRYSQSQKYPKGIAHVTGFFLSPCLYTPRTTAVSFNPPLPFLFVFFNPIFPLFSFTSVLFRFSLFSFCYFRRVGASRTIEISFISFSLFLIFVFLFKHFLYFLFYLSLCLQILNLLIKAGF